MQPGAAIPAAPVHAPVAYAAPPAPPAAAPPPGFSANKGRTVAVYVGLAILSLVLLLFIPKINTQIDQLKAVDDLQAGRPTKVSALQLLNDVKENDDTIETMNGLLALSFFGTGVAFLFWVHRAYKNLVALNAGNLPATPAFAVWSFIIPIASLYLGYLRVKEIWQASGPEGVNSRLTGPNWMTVAVPFFVPLWWSSFVGSQLVRLGVQVSKPADDDVKGISALQDYDSAMIGLLAVTLLISGLAIYVISQMTKRQNAAAAYLQPPAFEGAPTYTAV